MTLRELIVNHDRSAIEQWSRDRARTAYMGDALLCRVLGSLNLYVDPKNYDMTPWLALDGFWESWITMAIGRAVQPSWACLDAGAWCGYYSVILGDLVGEAGKVISFEPNRLHHPLCNRSLGANGYHWASCRNVAIGDQVGESAFYQTDGGGSRLSEHGQVTVKVQTIDSLDLPKLDFIKIDIEGSEDVAWAGMQRTLARNPNCIIVMEWNPSIYKDTEHFADDLVKFAGLREITTDGATKPISKEQSLQPTMRMLWLQK